MKYSIREMRLEETKSMIDYFLRADADFLTGMGVDKNKLPSATEWFDLLTEDFVRPIEQKQFYYLVWLANGIPIGHCNINKIEFGQAAFMHLHIWEAEHRRSGCAANLLNPSIREFFRRFELRELVCEPYAKNLAPNKALPKAGFDFVRTYDTTPGWIAFCQPVNRWTLDRERVLGTSPSENRETSIPQSSPTTRYIHGTSLDEQARLSALNRLTNQSFVEFLNVQPDMRVLEVGSGLGLLVVDVVSAASGVSVVGVELSQEQIDAANQAPEVNYVQGDAQELEFRDESFDLTYSRYLLEHLSDPVCALGEMRRVTRHNGKVVVCENDISLVRVDPPCPSFDKVWGKFQEFQRSLGGNAGIGTSLFRLFREAGFREVELSVQPEVHWHGSRGFEAWIQNLIGNIRGVQLELVETGLCSEEAISLATQELEALTTNSEASSWFVWNRAVATR